jgi:hypothetical protein
MPAEKSSLARNQIEGDCRQEKRSERMRGAAGKRSGTRIS